MGQTIGPSSGPVGAGRSAAPPRVSVEGGSSTAAPHELIGAGGSTAVPEVLTERGGSTAVPLETRETSPSAQEQGAGSKQSRPDELEQESGGSSPKRSYHPTVPA